MFLQLKTEFNEIIIKTLKATLLLFICMTLTEQSLKGKKLGTVNCTSKRYKIGREMTINILFSLQNLGIS